MEETQERLVAQGLRAGHADAWRALYDAFAERVWRAVARLVGPSSADVADIVQETFMAAARAGRQYDPEKGAVWFWLWGIARRQLALHYRKQQRQDRLRLAETWLANGNGRLQRWLDGHAEPPGSALEAGELAELVRATLEPVGRLRIAFDRQIPRWEIGRRDRGRRAGHAGGGALQAGAGPHRVPRRVFPVCRFARGAQPEADVTSADDDPDDPLAHLLGAADRDAAPPDRAFLARLRDQSVEAFLASSNLAPGLPGENQTPSLPGENRPPASRGLNRARAMTTRLIGALAAALALVFAVYYQKPDKTPKPNESLAFGKALESVTGAKTFHLKVTRDGKSAAELWAEKGGRLRVEDGSEVVTLSDGELIWRVNQKTGKASGRKDGR